MIPRHVTSVAAIFVCNLLLSCVHSAPNAELLKLLASRRSSDLVNSPMALPALTSLLNHYYTALSAATSTEDAADFSRDSVGNSLTSAGSLSPEEETGSAEQRLPEAAKRFNPAAYYASRGKRFYSGLTDGLQKRFFLQGFVGSRGKRLQPGLLVGEGEEEVEEGKRMSKRFNPSGFIGSRGKRYIPGLEALFLSQMYRKLDAEKWKRQSLLGFHAARG